MRTHSNLTPDAEQELQASRQFIEAVAKASPPVIYVFDLNESRLTYLNRSLLGDLGYGAAVQQEVAHLEDFKAFMPLEDLAHLERVLTEWRSLADGQLRDDEYRLRDASGATRWFLGRETMFARRADGTVRQVLGTLTDITDRKIAEARLRESEMHLAASQRVARIGSWELDLAPSDERRTRNSLRWSDECFRVFGCSPGETDVSHDAILSRVAADDRPRVEEAIRGALERGEPFSLDHRIVLADGSERVVHQQVEVVRNESGRPVKLIGTVQDVTDRLRLEDQLCQSQKLQALGQVVGGVAHDFNNTLTVVGGLTELLLDRLPADDKAREDVIAIREANEHAASLTRQLLLFSRRAALAVRDVDCNALVVRTIRMLKRLIGEDVILATSLSPAVPAIKADPTQIEQVVINLAINARDAMSNGGRLTIDTRMASFTIDDCRVHPEYAPGRYVQIVVSDTGCGMTPAVKKRLFEPFFTTKAPGKGTGLGLATVYGIVRQSGGFITVSSEAGRGTTFNVFLPAIDAVEPIRPSLGEEPALLGRETVLVVEDDANVRHLTRMVLERYGYCVLEATDGGAALRLVTSYTEPIHLLISDVVMPEMSGPVLAQALLDSGRLSRVLFMTGYDGDALAGAAAGDVRGPLLRKPFTPRELAAKVREVLDAA